MNLRYGKTFVHCRKQKASFDFLLDMFFLQKIESKMILDEKKLKSNYAFLLWIIQEKWISFFAQKRQAKFFFRISY